MGDDLKAIVKAAVVLTVDQVLLPVGDAEDTLRVVGVFPAAIDLQLDTEESVSLPIEDGLGLMVITSCKVFITLLEVFHFLHGFW